MDEDDEGTPKKLKQLWHEMFYMHLNSLFIYSYSCRYDMTTFPKVLTKERLNKPLRRSFVRTRTDMKSRCVYCDDLYLVSPWHDLTTALKILTMNFLAANCIDMKYCFIWNIFL